MPFIEKRPPVPDKSFWDTPRGRVRHIEVSSDGYFATYILEEQPGKVRMKIQLKGDLSPRIDHEVFLPWRYFMIRVSYQCRVDTANPGYGFFATKQLGLDDSGLLAACFPNMYPTGAICLGYGIYIHDKTPVRTAWRALRYLYREPWTSWVTSALIPSHLRQGHFLKECFCPSYDTICRMTKLSQDDVMKENFWVKADWKTLRSVLQGAPVKYQGYTELTDTNILRASGCFSMEEFMKRGEA